jgi:two-component system NarL family sensor kinase
MVRGWIGVLAVLSLIFLTVGAYLAGRRPANAVGWLLAFLLLLFPHGRLPSRRWRPFAFFTVAVYLSLSPSAALSPGVVQLYHPQVIPPGPPARGRRGRRRLRGAAARPAAAAGRLPGSLLLRLRRAPGEERQQVTVQPASASLWLPGR